MHTKHKYYMSMCGPRPQYCIIQSDSASWQTKKTSVDYNLVTKNSTDQLVDTTN